jgi:hypothetical protein
MHKFILLGFILGVSVSIYTADASAAVCARGVNAAGCIGPRGAVVARRHPRGGAVVRSTRVSPRRGVTVHRRTVIR